MFNSENKLKSFFALWKFRELFGALFWTYLKLRHVGSVLGFIWTLVNPVIFIFIYWIVFTQFIHMDLPHYPFFLIPGYLAWNFSYTSIVNSGPIINENKYLITKIAFPNEIIIFSNIAVYFLDFMIAMSIYFLILIIFYSVQLNLILLLPIIIIIQLIFTLGLSLLVACVSVYFKDMAQIIVLLGNIIFFLTPIFYPLNFIKGNFKILLLINPMTSIITIYHDILYYHVFPSINMILFICLFSVSILSFGYFIFNKYKYRFAELT
jgi:lipopolysaccharide transport system permease protein